MGISKIQIFASLVFLFLITASSTAANSQKTEPTLRNLLDASEKPSTPETEQMANRKKLLETKKCVGCYLDEADLKNADLKNADLSGASLRNASLKGADLSEADLKNADLKNADLSGASLRNADLSYATLEGASFSKAEVQGANFIKVKGLNPDVTQLALAGATVALRRGSLTEVMAQSSQVKLKIKYEYGVDTRKLQVIRGSQIFPEQAFTVGERSYGPRKLQIKDLDGDKEPEIIADFHSGGAHCCKFSWIFRYDSQQQRYTGIRQDWGDLNYTLRQTVPNRVPQFDAFDTRFTYRFGGFAESRHPVRIWRYRQGKMLDVTRQYPEQIKKQSELILRQLINYRGDMQYARPIVATYMATQYLLGEEKAGWEQVKQFYKARDRHLFFDELLSFLQTTGYAPNPALKRRLTTRD